MKTYEAKLTRKKIAEEPLTITHKKLELICEKALYWCDPCEEPDHETCELREVLFDLNIEPYNRDTDGCQYCFTKKKTRRKIPTVEEFNEFVKIFYNTTGDGELAQLYSKFANIHKENYKTSITEKVLKSFVKTHRPNWVLGGE